MIEFLFGVIAGFLLWHGIDFITSYFMRKLLLKAISNDKEFHDVLISLIKKHTKDKDE